MKTRKFVCDACHREFKAAWTEEEALAEKEAIWGDIPIDEMTRVCDDCWHKMGFGQ